jgi:hypothetical protein
MLIGKALASAVLLIQQHENLEKNEKIGQPEHIRGTKDKQTKEKEDVLPPPSRTGEEGSGSPLIEELTSTEGVLAETPMVTLASM